MTAADAATDRRLPKATLPYVTVACKIHIPWFELRLCEKRQVKEQSLTGERVVDQYVPSGDVVRVRGVAYPSGTVPEGFGDKPRMLMGYALTEGVPRAFWEKWSEQYKLAPFVKSGMIFAFDNGDEAKIFAKENVDVLSGLEPIHRKGKVLDDKRIGRPSHGAVAPIEPDVERMAQRSSSIG